MQARFIWIEFLDPVQLIKAFFKRKTGDLTKERCEGFWNFAQGPNGIPTNWLVDLVDLVVDHKC
jgi:hypothetical protein